MQPEDSNRKWGHLAVPMSDFQLKLQQQPTVSMLSRLALLHQVAKTYVLETLAELPVHAQDVRVEELTDPPMFDLVIEDAVVLIHYSYKLD
ncbi:hypothetical protein [Spirosoma fluminis]